MDNPVCSPVPMPVDYENLSPGPDSLTLLGLHSTVCTGISQSTERAT